MLFSWPQTTGKSFVTRLLLYLATVTLALAAWAPAASADGRFARLFPDLAPLNGETPQQLADLAQTQLDPNADSGDNPGVPAGFTYLGQFIDHDLTLDSVPQPSAPVDPTTITNDRTPRFDLDSVYGGGPDDSPQLYEADGRHFRVQLPNEFGVPDLPRRPDGSAILVEPRNDENQIIAQIHVAFLRLHNHFVDRGMSFSEARTQTLNRYRRVVFTDYLPHVVGAARYRSILRTLSPSNGSLQGLLASLKVKDGVFDGVGTPVEFSVANFRYGHSQVRRAYNVNDDFGDDNKIQVFQFTGDDLRGGRPIAAEHRVDFGEFFDGIEDGPFDCDEQNCSRKLDTLISRSLFQLPIPGAEAEGSNVLAFRNLLRAKFYDLPSYESVARRLGVTPAGSPVFPDGTPLWYGALREGELQNDGRVLGAVNARIVVETFADFLRRTNDQGGVGRPFTAGGLLREAGAVD